MGRKKGKGRGSSKVSQANKSVVVPIPTPQPPKPNPTTLQLMQFNIKDFIIAFKCKGPFDPKVSIDIGKWWWCQNFIKMVWNWPFVFMFLVNAKLKPIKDFEDDGFVIEPTQNVINVSLLCPVSVCFHQIVCIWSKIQLCLF